MRTKLIVRAENFQFLAKTALAATLGFALAFPIAVFAQNEQEQYAPQGQYQYPPPQAYPPPQYQQQGYPPPQAYPPPQYQQQQQPQYGANVEQPAKQEGGKAMKFGTRAGLVMSSFSTGNKSEDKDIDMGMGFGVGGVLSYPITDIITFNPEAAFLYRTLYNYSNSGTEQSANEFAISVPLMVQVMPIAGMPVHFAGGIQIDLPFSSKQERSRNGQTESKKIDKRTTLDFGIALGGGYRVMPNISVDLRIVIGLTSLTSENDDETSFNQYGLGVSYFF